MKVYIDGEFHDEAEAKISVFDHGLLYGDGVFEGIRAYHGKVFLLQEHLDRLYEGARAIALTIPVEKQAMAQIIHDTLAANGLRDAYIRLVVTRGRGDLGLNPYLCKRATIICITASIQLYPEALYEKGLPLVTVATPAVNPEALNPRIKSLNYLNNILAKIEAINAGVEEAVMLNGQGFVAECTGDNIFLVQGEVLKTPPPEAGILEGCTRKAVMGLAREAGLAVVETNLQRYDLYTADECFLTGTAAEVIPVIAIDGRPIGDGVPGARTRALIAAFRALTAEG